MCPCISLKEVYILILGSMALADKLDTEWRKMSAQSATVMGSLHQDFWTKACSIHPKVLTRRQYQHHKRVSLSRLCKASNIKGSLIIGQPSSTSVSDLKTGGSFAPLWFDINCSWFRSDLIIMYYVDAAVSSLRH